MDKPVTEIVVIGKAILLSDDRMVWLGKCPKFDNSFLVLFENKGVKTKLRLSTEALKALVALESGEGINFAQAYSKQTQTWQLSVKS